MTSDNSLTRQEALVELKQYGIHGSQIYLLDMIPLIEMAWADRNIQDIEIAVYNYYLNQHLEKINWAAGQQVLTLEEAQSFSTPFLRELPNFTYLRAVRGLIPPIRLSSPDPDENKAIQQFIISGCLDIAASAVSHYPYELTGRISALEKQYFFEILETLHY